MEKGCKKMRDDHRREFKGLVRDLILACGGTVATRMDVSVDFLKQQAAMEALEAYVDEKTIAFGLFAIKYAKETGRIQGLLIPEA